MYKYKKKNSFYSSCTVHVCTCKCISFSKLLYSVHVCFFIHDLHVAAVPVAILCILCICHVVPDVQSNSYKLHSLSLSHREYHCMFFFRENYSSVELSVCHLISIYLCLDSMGWTFLYALNTLSGSIHLYMPLLAILCTHIFYLTMHKSIGRVLYVTCTRTSS